MVEDGEEECQPSQSSSMIRRTGEVQGNKTTARR